MADTNCCENCCCCCCHGNVNLVSVMAHLGGWMISIGIITCIFGFTALADAKDVHVFKVTAMLLCALGVPTSLASLYVNQRVRTLAEGHTDYLKTRDALFDVFTCTGALLMMLGFIFMMIGFSVQSNNLVLLYFGVMGCIQFVVGMLDLLCIRVWVRGSQPRTGRGNILDVILDLRYPVIAFETTRYAYDNESSTPSTPEPERVYEQDLGEPTGNFDSLAVEIQYQNGANTIDILAEAMQYQNGTLTAIHLPAAPPTYEEAVATSRPTEDTTIEVSENVQFEPPPAYTA